MKTNSRNVKGEIKNQDNFEGTPRQTNEQNTLLLKHLKGGKKMGEDKREGQRDGGVAASLQYFICQLMPEHHRTAESALANGFTVHESSRVCCVYVENNVCRFVCRPSYANDTNMVSMLLII